MDLKWGIDRLPELVSPETAAKYGSAFDKLNAAITAQDADEIVARVGVCIRGMAAMDAEAERLGRDPKPPELIEVELEGRRIALMPDDRRWHAYERDNPGVELFTLRQAAVALADRQENSPAVQEARRQDASPTPAPQKPQTDWGAEIDDEIPW